MTVSGLLWACAGEIAQQGEEGPPAALSDLPAGAAASAQQSTNTNRGSVPAATVSDHEHTAATPSAPETHSASTTGSGASSPASGTSVGTASSDFTSSGSAPSSAGAQPAAPAGAATPPASSSVWRPFSDDSPWNTPIAASPSIDAQSSAMIDDWTTASPFGSYLGINIDDYSVPLYWADASTATFTVPADIGGMGWSSSDGFNATATVPIPADAAPDPQSDAHMLIVDRARSLEWGFFNATHSGNSWNCKLCATADLNGTGTRPAEATNPTWYTSHGPRACGFPLIAGLIRTEEIEAGAIEHALVVAYPHIRAGMYTYPASTAQAKVNEAIKTRGIPCGGRVQLDPSLDLDALGLSQSGKIIARALQKYGAYVGDYSGSMSLYAENAPQALSYWRGGVLSSGELRDKIELQTFRVLTLGQLNDDGNGD